MSPLKLPHASETSKWYACIWSHRGPEKGTQVFGTLSYTGQAWNCTSYDSENHCSLLRYKPNRYRPNETARLTTDPDLQRDARQVSIRDLAEEAEVSEKAVKAARRRERLRRSTVEKLKKALCLLQQPSFSLDP